PGQWASVATSMCRVEVCVMRISPCYAEAKVNACHAVRHVNLCVWAHPYPLTRAPQGATPADRQSRIRGVLDRQSFFCRSELCSRIPASAFSPRWAAPAGLAKPDPRCPGWAELLLWERALLANPHCLRLPSFIYSGPSGP